MVPAIVVWESNRVFRSRVVVLLDAAGVVSFVACQIFNLLAQELSPTTLLAALYGSVFPLPLVLIAKWLRPRPARVRAGTDGILLRDRERERFISFADVASISKLRNGLRVVVGEEPLWMDFAPDEPSPQTRRARSRVRRMQEAILRAHRAFEASSDAALGSCIARGGRSAELWLRDLAALRAGSYRRPAISDDDLWRIVEDATADPSARVGAAKLLRGGLDDAGRRRLGRVAADGARPDLREALRLLGRRRRQCGSAVGVQCPSPSCPHRPSRCGQCRAFPSSDTARHSG